MIEQSLIRFSAVSKEGESFHTTTRPLKSHSPHSKNYVTKKDSYADILRLMKENNTDNVNYFENGYIIGSIYKDDIVQRLIEIIDSYEASVENIVHDLKHPIANIQGINYLLRSERKGWEKDVLIAKSDESCKYATDLLNDFLSSQCEDYTMINCELIDMNDIIRECLPAYKMMLTKKKQHFSIELCHEPLQCVADKLKIHRVIDNLMTNAIKFTPEGGKIKISSRRTNTTVEVDVIDNGIGIPAENQKKIFARFTTASRVGTQGEPSTGLGLSITQKIVEAHNGTIVANSEIGVGTTISVQLPIHNVLQRSKRSFS